jgi:O-antigen ligase
VVRLSPKARRFSITWTPAQDAPNARLYAWLPAPGSFELVAVELRSTVPDSTASKLTTAATSPAALSRAAAAKERFNLHFRREMLSLAARAFSDHPLRGIGWERFPFYVSARTVYGEQGAQSEYARYAAELGIGGVMFLLALAAVAIVGLRTAFPHRAAVAGSLTVAAVGLAFDNALEITGISAIVAVMLAIAGTRGGRASTNAGEDVELDRS